jgi:hypothetical protein
MFNNLSTFQKWTSILLLTALGTCAGIIISLLVVLSVMQGRLAKLGDTMAMMAEQHITKTISVNDTIPLNSSIMVTDAMSVGIDMMVETTIPFRAEIPVSQNMLVPIRIGVNEYIKLDTTIRIKDVVHIQVNDTIPMNQKMKMPIFGKRGPSFPIAGNIPLQQDLAVSFNEVMHVESMIPINLLIIDTLPIGLQMRIPVDLLIPIKIPIHSMAKVSFKEAMPVDGSIPIKMDIPVDIPMAETSLAEYFRKMAEGLKGLTELSFD